MRSGLSGCTRTSALATGWSGASLLGQGPANWQRRLPSWLLTVDVVESCCVERDNAATARLPRCLLASLSSCHTPSLRMTVNQDGATNKLTLLDLRNFGCRMNPSLHLGSPKQSKPLHRRPHSPHPPPQPPQLHCFPSPAALHSGSSCRLWAVGVWLLDLRFVVQG